MVLRAWFVESFKRTLGLVRGALAIRWALRAGVTAALALTTMLGTAAAAGGAANECRGIEACVAVEGPWVAVRHGVESHFLLSCPGHGIVAGTAGVATTDVQLSFDGRLGSPIKPGVTTSTSAYFRGILVGGRIAAFQPWLGCVEVSGGGRVPVSARVVPGAELTRRTRILWLRAGERRTASLRCPAGKWFVGGWHAIAFYTRDPPTQRELSLVRASQVVAALKISVVASASKPLPDDAHALVQLGAACAT